MGASVKNKGRGAVMKFDTAPIRLCPDRGKCAPIEEKVTFSDVRAYVFSTVGIRPYTKSLLLFIRMYF